MNVTNRRSAARGRRFRVRRAGAALLAVMAAAAVSSAGSTAPLGAAAPGRFPGARWAKGLGAVHLSSPVVADVNGDGHLDVLTADLAGVLHVLDGRTGRDLRGWPQAVQVIPGQTVAVESSPTVADLDRNGQKEIIVGAGSVDYPGQQGGVVAFNANGSVRWRLKTMTIANVNGVQGTPAVGDVDGDGFPDVVFGSFDQRIYALNRFGNPLPGFPYYSQDTIWDSPALYDTAHIGRMDIFIGSDASPGGPCGSWSWAGVMRAIRETPTGPIVLWQHCQHQIFQSSPAIGQLNGRMAVVFGTGTGPSGDAVATRSLGALYLDTGTPVPGWPVRLSGAIFGSPVIGDVTGDKRNEVVVGTFDGQVWAVAANGHRLWNKYGAYLSTPILVDLDGNGVNDVGIGDTGGFNLLRGRDGATLYNKIDQGRVIEDSAAVANFGRGYGWRLIVQSGSGSSGLVESYPLPKAPRIKPAWPQWRRNPNHTASPPLAPLRQQPPAHAGYWLVGSDGGMFAYGNAKFYGSTGAMHLNRPIVGMASTQNGHGYWLVASDGGMFSFGNAKFHGSTGAIHLVQPIVGMAPTPSGRGYWLVASDGGIFAFGNAKFYGSTGGRPLGAPIATLVPSTTGHGYWLIGQNGDVFNFGDAKYFGSPAGRTNQPIVSAAASRRS